MGYEFLFAVGQLVERFQHVLKPVEFVWRDPEPVVFSGIPQQFDRPAGHGNARVVVGVTRDDGFGQFNGRMRGDDECLWVKSRIRINQPALERACGVRPFQTSLIHQLAIVGKLLDETSGSHAPQQLDVLHGFVAPCVAAGGSEIAHPAKMGTSGDLAFHGHGETGDCLEDQVRFS